MCIREIAKKNDGFTLVELIVVIVIIGILASITVPSFVGYIDKAKDNELITECRLTVTAAQSFAAEEYAFGEISKGKEEANEAFVNFVKDLSEVPAEASISYISLFDADVSELAYIRGEKGVLFKNKTYTIFKASEMPAPPASGAFTDVKGLAGEEKKIAIEANARLLTQAAEVAVKRMLADMFQGQNIVGFSKGIGMTMSQDALVGGFSVFDASGNEIKNVNLNIGKYMIEEVAARGVMNTDTAKTNFGYSKITFVESSTKGVYTTTPKTIEFKGVSLSGDSSVTYIYDCVSGKIVSPIL